MKTRIILMLLAVVFVCSHAMSQEKKRPDREKFETMQCNQIVKSLALDDATAAKFVPVYKQYLKDLRSLHTPVAKKPGAKGEARVQQKSDAMPTDAQVEQEIKERFAQSRKMLDMREKYYYEFRKILSPKQIMKMYQLEKGNAHRFQKELIQRQKEGKKGIEMHHNNNRPQR